MNSGLFKKTVAALVTAAAIIFAAAAILPHMVLAAETLTFDVTYHQTEARDLLNSINAWRNAGTTYKNPSNEEVETGELASLTYDYELEAYAMQRAAEIALSFSHTRPDGTGCLAGTGSYGENIAYNSSGDASASEARVFVQWKEDEDDYDGQGHRRNMLGKIYISGSLYSGTFTSIGIGCAEYNGIYYWVQEFGYSNTGAAETTANNSQTTVSVNYENSNVTTSYRASESRISLKVGQSQELPTVNKMIGSVRSDSIDVTWTSGDSSIAEISGNTVTALDSGSTTLTGTYTVDGTTSTVSVSFSSTKTYISNTTISEVPDQVYSSSGVTPSVVITDGTKTLVQGTDYTLSYLNNTYVGTAYVKITGIGAYQGTKYVTFNIVKPDISSAVITGIGNKTYTGSATSQNLTVTYNGNTLTAGTDYTLSYSNNINVGTATVTITGKGSYTGSVDKTYTINQASIANSSAAAIQNQTYTGSEIKPALTITFGGNTLSEGTDYILEYSDNVNVGTASVTITGKGNFTGSKTVTFTITQASIKNATFSAIPSQTFTGSEIKPGITAVFGGDTLAEGTDYTLTYSNNVIVGTATVKITGIGNFKGTKTVSFTITCASINTASIVIYNNSPYYYIASEIRPDYYEVRLRGLTLVEGSAYTAEFSNNVNPGTATITVNGCGNYTGSVSDTYTITQLDLNGGNVVVDGLDNNFTFTGSEIEPSVTVSVMFRGDLYPLTEGTDYTLTYSNNIAVGTGYVSITGIGNCTGSLNKTFSINQASLDDVTIAAVPDQEYTGSEIIPDLVISYGDYILESDVDYSITSNNDGSVGEASVAITGLYNFDGSRTVTFNIRRSISDDGFAIQNISDCTYTGSRIKPNVVLSCDGTALTEGTDYTVSYSRNVNAGTATATVTGAGDYMGTMRRTFVINPASIVNASVSENFFTEIYRVSYNT